jgi:Periplasmic binding protein-like domain
MNHSLFRPEQRARRQNRGGNAPVHSQCGQGATTCPIRLPLPGEQPGRAAGAAQHADIRVPRDVVLMGFGDIPLAEYVVPPLTTMRVPAFDLGFTAGEMLTRLIANQDRPIVSVTLNTELIIRETCGASLPESKGLT